MSRTFTLAVERVADDRRFAERFRRDPHRALRRYRLTDGQVDAIKSGEFVPLASHGLDAEQFQDGKRHGWRPYWRKAVVGVTVLGAAIGLMGAPASAANDVCDIKTCPGGKPLFVGLRAVRNLRVRADTIRLGDLLVTRASARRALRARGMIRSGRAYGRVAIRDLFGDVCSDACVAEVDGDPVLLAEAP